MAHSKEWQETTFLTLLQWWGKLGMLLLQLLVCEVHAMNLPVRLPCQGPVQEGQLRHRLTNVE